MRHRHLHLHPRCRPLLQGQLVDLTLRPLAAPKPVASTTTNQRHLCSTRTWCATGFKTAHMQRCKGKQGQNRKGEVRRVTFAAPPEAEAGASEINRLLDFLVSCGAPKVDVFKISLTDLCGLSERTANQIRRERTTREGFKPALFDRQLCLNSIGGLGADPNLDLLAVLGTCTNAYGKVRGAQRSLHWDHERAAGP
jgi:hypothetical protein